MNRDTAQRKYRFIEVRRSTEFQQVVRGWLETAELLSPRTPKALLEGDYLAALPDGTSFKEICFKAEFLVIEEALTHWRRHSGRRSAVIVDEEFRISDGSSCPLQQIAFKPIDAE